MTVYQGEELTIEGFLRDDKDSIVAELPRMLSFLLRKEDEVVAIWTTARGIDGAYPVTVTTVPIDETTAAEMASFTLREALTAALEAGAYTLEQKMTDDKGVTIGVAMGQIKVCATLIGKVAGI